MPVYLAKRPLRVGDEVRAPGSAVPEAAEWPKLKFWVEAGFIEVCNTPDEARQRLIEAGIPVEGFAGPGMGLEAAPEALVHQADPVTSSEDVTAPWGRKKDGTPKRRPGRKPAEVQ